MSRYPKISLRQAPGHWAFLGVILILLVGYAPSFIAISEEWLGNGPYSHGFLGLLVATYLVRQKRAVLRNIQHKHSGWALVITFLAGFGWFLAAMINVQSVQLVSVLVILFSSLLFIFGWKTFWQLRIPMLSLLLVVPLWDFLQIPLQELSSLITFMGLKLLGIPILREGFIFSVPGGQFVIEEACSGLGFFLSSCLLSVLYIHYNHIVGSKRYFFFLFAISLSIVSNWVRILTVMIVGNYTQMEHIIVQNHLPFGWILFAITLIPFFVVGHFLSRTDCTHKEQPTTASSEDVVSHSQMKTVITAMTVLLIFPFISWLYSTLSTETQTSDWLQQELSTIMKPSNRWQDIKWSPHFVGASDQFLKQYRYNEQDILCLVIQYDHQEQGEELIYVNNIIYAKDRWNLREEKVLTINIEDIETSHRVLRLTSPYGPTRNLVYWYLIGGRPTTSPMIAKVYELIGNLTGDRSAYLVALAVDSFGNNSQAIISSLIEISGLLQVHLSKSAQNKINS